MKALEVNNFSKDNFETFSLKGEFKTLEAIQFKELLLNKISSNDAKNICIELNEVEEMDITALNSLIIGKRRTNKKGNIFKVKATKDHVINKLLNITRFDKYLIPEV